MKYKEFKLEELFYKAHTKRLPYKSKDLPIRANEQFDLPATTAAHENQGLSCFVPKGEATVLSNCISVAANGDGIAFYQPKPFTILQDSYALLPRKQDIPSRALLYCVAAIQFILCSHYTWTNKSTWNRIKTQTVTLPTSDGVSPDYAYMERYIRELEEERIRELEEERIRELEAYLTATGLNDYELTDQDKQILSLSTKSTPEQRANYAYAPAHAKPIKEFKLGDLFKKLDLKKKNKSFNKTKDVSTIRNEEFNLPLINAKHGNNGIMYYGKQSEWEHASYCLGIVNDGAISTGDVYPHIQRTGVLYNAYLIKPLFPIVTKNILIYCSAVIQKHIKHKYGYDNKAGWQKVKEEIISLPVNEHGTPDFDYMDKYIRAIEKLTIRAAVEYKNKQIDYTKQAIYAAL